MAVTSTEIDGAKPGEADAGRRGFMVAGWHAQGA